MDFSRVPRALSAFQIAAGRWTAIPLLNPRVPTSQTTTTTTTPHSSETIGKQTLTLTSWNIQASPSITAVARSKHILNHILKGSKSSDVIHLQEVTSSVRKSLLDDPTIRSSFLMSDAEDDASFSGVPFTTMTLLSRQRFSSPLLAKGGNEEKENEGQQKPKKLMLDGVFRMGLPSRYKRDALCIEIAAPAAPGTVLRLINVHLDSLDAHFRRLLQLQALARILREPGCSGGIIAGDFNAIYPEDHKLINQNELLDAWEVLYGKTGASGDTWGVGVELEDGLKAGRLDKVAMFGLEPDEIEVLEPGLVEADGPWSDHCGLRCTFTM